MKDKKYQRIMRLDLPPAQSAFVFGARSTGKSTFLKSHYPASIYYDLLDTEQVYQLRLKPGILREELKQASPDALQYPVIIDEVQKIPELLNEVHWLIENKKIGFILCGSSARKLKRGAANMLGGRAWKFTFYPLVYPELTDFDLLKILNHGLLPSIYQSSKPERAFRAYIDLYLNEEIFAEGLVRNLKGFARFLDLIGFSNGELLNYKKIAADCGIDAKTVKEYYQILIDTLIGYFVYPYAKNEKRQVISSTPKFYLFDVGVGAYLARRPIVGLMGEQAGKALEHYILTELMAYIGINERRDTIHYWRSKTGHEVDFVLADGLVAIEVKISDNPRSSDLKGIHLYCDDHQPEVAIVVCLVPRKRQLESGVILYPVQVFLEELWQGKILP